MLSGERAYSVLRGMKRKEFVIFIAAIMLLSTVFVSASVENEELMADCVNDIYIETGEEVGPDLFIENEDITFSNPNPSQWEEITISAEIHSIDGVQTCPVPHIEVEPNPATVTVGGVQLFTATYYDEFNNSIPGVGFIWTTNVGVVNSTGLFTAQTTPGTGLVTATNGTVNGSAIITVVPGPIDHIVVTPNPVTLPVGGTQQFTATAHDVFCNVIPAGWFVWSTNVGIINSTGFFTAMSTPGSGTVVATNGSLSGFAVVNVGTGTIDHIIVIPDPVSVPVGGTQQFTAIAHDVFCNEIPGVDFNWTTDVGVIDSNGLFTAQSTPGSGIVTATNGSVSGSASVTVVASPLDHIIVIPDPVTVPVGGTQVFMAIAHDVFCNEIPGICFTWTTDIGSIDANGLFTAQTVPGVGSVAATNSTVNGSASVTVVLGTLDHIIVTPDPVSIVVGGTQQFTAIAHDVYCNVIPGVSFNWTTNIGSIDGTGFFTAQTTPGSGIVTATNGTVTGLAVVDVIDGSLDHIDVFPSSPVEVPCNSGNDIYSGPGQNVPDNQNPLSFQVNATCTVSFYLNNVSAENLIYREYEVSVPNNGSTVVSHDWLVDVTGNHTIIVDITDSDPPESDLTNNTASKDISISEPCGKLKVKSTSDKQKYILGNGTPSGWMLDNGHNSVTLLTDPGPLWASELAIDICGQVNIGYTDINITTYDAISGALLTLFYFPFLNMWVNDHPLYPGMGLDINILNSAITNPPANCDIAGSPITNLQIDMFNGYNYIGVPNSGFTLASELGDNISTQLEIPKENVEILEWAFPFYMGTTCYWDGGAWMGDFQISNEDGIVVNITNNIIPVQPQTYTPPNVPGGGGGGGSSGDAQAIIIVKVTHQGERIENASVSAWVLDPVGGNTSVTMSEVSSGIYTGTYPFTNSSPPGVYRIKSVASKLGYLNGENDDSQDKFFLDSPTGNAPEVSVVEFSEHVLAQGPDVMITAEVTNPGAVNTIFAEVRKHGSRPVFSLPLYDDGTHSDTTPDDGIFTSSLPSGDMSGTFTADIYLNERMFENRDMLIVNPEDMVAFETITGLQASANNLYYVSAQTNVTLNVTTVVDIEDISFTIVEHRTLNEGKSIEIIPSANLQTAMEVAYIEVSYTESDIPAGVNETEMRIHLWDQYSDTLVPCEPGGVDPNDDIVWGDADHFSQFTITRHTSEFAIPLEPGWNLVSLPRVLSDTSVLNVLSSIDGKWDIARYYDAIDGHWRSYATFKPASLNDLWNIDHKMSFWLHTTEACTLSVYGQVPASTSIPLYSGWNLVGYPTSDDSMTVADALWGTGADRVEVSDINEPYNLKEVGPSYVMKPGEGYWIHVPIDTVWIV